MIKLEGIVQAYAYHAFHSQKSLAKWRGVGWELTFKQWWKIWQDSGHWHERGSRPEQYCMARKGPDIGPYKVGNVRIITNDENNREKKPYEWTDSQRQAQSQRNLGNKYGQGSQHNLGRKHTEEVKKQRSIAISAWWKSRKQKD